MIKTGKTKYTDRHVAKQGKIDGKLGIPPQDAEEGPPFVKEIHHAGTNALYGVLAERKEADKKLQPGWATAFDELLQAGRELTKPATALEDAERRFEAERNAKAPATDRRKFNYAIGCVVVWLLEVPLNLIAFRAAGDNELFTLAIALVIGIALVYAAHLSAVLLRRRQLRGAVAMIVVVAVVILGIGYLRALHMTAANQAHTVVDHSTGGTAHAPA